VTPNLHARMYMSSSPALVLTKVDKDTEYEGVVASPIEYKSVLHNARLGLAEEGVDVSGTRGMVRRKRSLTTGARGLWPGGR
jgi:hypothetical protein